MSKKGNTNNSLVKTKEQWSGRQTETYFEINVRRLLYIILNIVVVVVFPLIFQVNMCGRCIVHLQQSNTILWPTPQSFTIWCLQAYATAMLMKPRKGDT